MPGKTNNDDVELKEEKRRLPDLFPDGPHPFKAPKFRFSLKEKEMADLEKAKKDTGQSV